MNYFNHAIVLKNSNPYRAWKIYQAVYNSDVRYYAMNVYGSRFEDALNAAYHHILLNFDESIGDLEHYTTSIVGTINLNMYKHEIGHDEVLEIASDEEARKKNNGDPLEQVIRVEQNNLSSEVESCVLFLIPFFISDYKFFKTKKSSDRTLGYSELYKRYNVTTISKAMNYLVGRYSKSMDELYELKRKLKFRNYPEDRFKASLDDSIKYVCELNGVIIYKRENNSSSKILYEIDIQELISDLIKYFYSGRFNREIESLCVCCSLSGKLFCDIEELKECLENDIIGHILSRLQTIKVLRYERGKSIILVSSKPLSVPTVVLDILGKNFNIDLIQRTSRCIER